MDGKYESAKQAVMAQRSVGAVQRSPAPKAIESTALFDEKQQGGEGHRVLPRESTQGLSAVSQLPKTPAPWPLVHLTVLAHCPNPTHHALAAALLLLAALPVAGRRSMAHACVLPWPEYQRLLQRGAAERCA